jgi:predicted methyltransferase MtxX (methanogen marker protein 4)
LGDFAAEAVDDLGLADVIAVFGGGEIGAFGLDAAVDAGLAGDIAVALGEERAG